MPPLPQRVVSSHFTGNDRFSIVRPLGAGAMGEVYEVIDRDADQRVALKVLRRNDPRFLYRFKQEFRTVQALQHPNLAALGQLHEWDGQWFFTMELLAGSDFRRHVTTPGGDEPPVAECADTVDAIDVAVTASFGPGTSPGMAPGRAHFDQGRLRDGLRQLCEALHFLHGAGKIHCDVKPSNVMVTPEGRVVLLDFGLVTDAAPDDQSVDGGIVGTPIYMAPEQATGGRIDHSVDCYALGVMLYEILTGAPPFTGTLTEILVKKQCAVAPDPRDRASGIPDDLALLAMRLLAPEPAHRPTAADALELLSGVPGTWAAASSGAGRAAAFVGRVDEMEVLRRALDQTLAAGAPRVVHIEAESGVGKSSLIDQFVATVRTDRTAARVVAGRCYEREMTNYRAFDAVVDAIVRVLRHCDDAQLAAVTPADAWFLTRMFPMFASVRTFSSASASDATIEHDARRRAYGAFSHVLRVLASTAPLVVVVDDVQWADSDSLRLLAELLRMPAAPPILWILASRPVGDDDARGPSQRWLREALRTEITSLPLAPLSAELARQLAQQLLGVGGDPTVAAGIADEAGGHPLHIAELVRHAIDGGGQHLRLDEAILQRLARLPAAAQELADVLALAGAPLRPATLRRAAEVSPLEFDRAVAVLRIGHLARRSGSADDELLEPYHDRVREAVAGRLDDDRRRLLHTRVAAALTATGAPPELLVRHFEGAGALARAGECALDAAHRATSAMAYDRATEMFQTALRLGSHGDDDRRELRMRLGEAFIRAGRGRAAAETFAAAADGADPGTRLHCRLQSSEQLLLSGHIDDGLRAVGEVLGELGMPLPATPRAAIVAVLRGRIALRFQKRTWVLRRESEIPREVLTRLDLYRAVGHGLTMVDNLRGAIFNAHFLRLARVVGEPMRLCRALGVEAICLGSLGDSAGEQRILDELERLATEVDAPYARAWLAGALACRDYFAGRFACAARRFALAEDMWRETRTEVSDLPVVRVLRGFALMDAGDFGQLKPLADRWLAEADERGDLFLGTMLRRAFTMMSLARGDLAGVDAALDLATWTSAAGSFHLQHWYEVQARTELALYRGDAADRVVAIDRCMNDLRRSHILRIQIVRCAATWLQGRVHLAAACGPAEIARAAALARRNARRLRREKVGYAALWAELLTASERTAVGDRDGAVRALRAAAALGVDDLAMYGMIARHGLASRVDAVEGAMLLAAVATTAAAMGIRDVAMFAAGYLPTPAPSRSQLALAAAAQG